MAGRKNYDGTLLDVAGQGAPSMAIGLKYLRSGSAERVQSSLTFVVSMTAGTGTWVLEGRNGPNDVGVQLDTGSAGKTAKIVRMGRCGSAGRLLRD
jgi:hypothetical protein